MTHTVREHSTTMLYRAFLGPSSSMHFMVKTWLVSLDSQVQKWSEIFLLCLKKGILPR